MCGKNFGEILTQATIGVLTGGVGLVAYNGYRALQRDADKNKKIATATANSVNAENNRIQATARANALAKQPIQTVFAGGQQQAGGLFGQ